MQPCPLVPALLLSVISDPENYNESTTALRLLLYVLKPYSSDSWLYYHIAPICDIIRGRFEAGKDVSDLVSVVSKCLSRRATLIWSDISTLTKIIGEEREDSNTIYGTRRFAS